MNRREYLLTAGVVSATLLAGCLGDDHAAESEAESFMDAVAASDSSDAEAHLHPDSEIRDPIAVVDNQIQETLDGVAISVEDTDLLEDGDEVAIVEVTVEVDRPAQPYTTPIEIELRTDGGDWRVWAIG